MKYNINDNQNITEQVWRILDENPCIRINLAIDVINTRALAKYIMKERKLKTTVDAVISAIRRYNYEDSENIFKKAQKIIKKTVAISTSKSLP